MKKVKPILAQDERAIVRKPNVIMLILSLLGIPILLLAMALVMPYRSAISDWGEGVDNWFAQVDNLKHTALFCCSILFVVAGKLTYDKFKRM